MTKINLKELWNQYLADQQDGFVSNLDSWEDIKLKQQADIYPFYRGTKKETESYVIECPWCGLKHSMDKEKGKPLLSHPDKAMRLQCASDFGEAGCKNVIIIMTEESLKKCYTYTYKKQLS
jgi:hypothetical protein